MNKLINKLLTSILIITLISLSAVALNQVRKSMHDSVNVVTLDKKYPVSMRSGTNYYNVRIIDSEGKQHVGNLSSIAYYEMVEGKKYLVSDAMVEKGKWYNGVLFLLSIVIGFISFIWWICFMLGDVLLKDKMFTITFLKETK